jgi:hypothetical protein
METRVSIGLVVCDIIHPMRHIQNPELVRLERQTTTAMQAVFKILHRDRGNLPPELNAAFEQYCVSLNESVELEVAIARRKRTSARSNRALTK